MKRWWFKIVEKSPRILQSARGWDFAASEDQSAKQSAGVKMGLGDDGDIYILDAKAGWWGSGDRDNMIVHTATGDGKATDIALEQEPGSGGKAQVEALERKLLGFKVFVERATGSKQLRADPLSSAAQNGRVKLVRGDWNEQFLSQVETFPKGMIDLIDAAAHTFNHLADSVRGPVKAPISTLAPSEPSRRVFGGGFGGNSPGGRIF